MILIYKIIHIVSLLILVNINLTLNGYSQMLLVGFPIYTLFLNKMDKIEFRENSDKTPT